MLKACLQLETPPDVANRHSSSSSLMAKRPHESGGTTVKVKRQNGIRIRTVTVPDSDDDNPVLKVDTEYARLFKTRVSAAGKAENVTMKTLQIFEAKEVPQDNPEPIANDCEAVITENPTSTKKAKKQRKRGNDSVSVFCIHYCSANDLPDQDVDMVGRTVDGPR